MKAVGPAGIAAIDSDQRVERLRAILTSARTSNDNLNAFIALDTTVPADATVTSGSLAGIVVAVKDNIDAIGFPTTCGSGFFDRVPEQDAPIVARFRAAGAHLVGKTNLGEFALDATSNNPHFGAVRNPYDSDRTAGGSSGGSAAAVAAGLADIALGTDSGGSVRIPAALCGVAGYRPTARTWPLEGIVGPAWSVDSYGLIARTTEDIRAMVETLNLVPNCGEDTTRPATPRIGYLSDDSMGPAHPDLWDHYIRSIETLRAAGFNCEPTSLTGLRAAPYACAVIAYSEVATGHRESLTYRPTEYGELVRPLLYLGRSFTTRDYFRAQQSRLTFLKRYLDQARAFDFVLTPTVPMTAPRLGVDPHIPGDEGALALFAYIRYTCLANLIDMPTVSIAAGTVEDGLPTGIQIIGKWHSDVRLLEVASALERALRD